MVAALKIRPFLFLALPPFSLSKREKESKKRKDTTSGLIEMLPSGFPVARSLRSLTERNTGNPLGNVSMRCVRWLCASLSERDAFKPARDDERERHARLPFSHPSDGRYCRSLSSTLAHGLKDERKRITFLMMVLFSHTLVLTTYLLCFSLK